jgi:hypothetical protein
MRRVLALLGGVALLLALLPGSTVAIVAGAGFTTVDESQDGPGHCLNGNPGVNCNIYDGKQYVWLNGGPVTGQISPGTYFFAVLEPAGQNDPNDGGAKNLSCPSLPCPAPYTAYTDRTFTKNNDGTVTYNGTHDFDNPKIRLAPYADTGNPGGVYILAICSLPSGYPASGYPVSPSDCKYDAFKIKAGPPVTPFGVVSGAKYYDANTNGQWDAGEPGIGGWPINFSDLVSGSVTTDVNGQFTVSLLADTYTFWESVANSPWVQTGNLVNQSSTSGGATVTLNGDKSYTVELVDNSTASGLYFGNVCLGAGGGHTLGFWSNKNGQAIMKNGDNFAAALAFLSSLNLRKADGSNFDPSSYTDFRTWLLNASATNMAYMLSAQLAAMELNVRYGFVSGNALIYAPGTNSANANGFATVNAVMAEANTELGVHGTAYSGDAWRSYQEALKNALDNANNNLTFVQPGPESCPTPVFP